MDALRRHRLVRLTSAAWSALLGRPWDAQAQACLAHWAAHDLPLVVTTQRRCGAPQDVGVSLGLPAPLCWGRRRLALQLPVAALAAFDEFPRAAALSDQLPAAHRMAWRALNEALAAQGGTAHVFGSHGWQYLSGLAYVREGSDIDLWIAVQDAAQADAVAASLLAFDGPRLDGECVFASGEAVNWREWAGWRSGRARSLLVRRLGGAVLASDFAPGLETA